jgi:hypothetical protein
MTEILKVAHFLLYEVCDHSVARCVVEIRWSVLILAKKDRERHIFLVTYLLGLISR